MIYMKLVKYQFPNIEDSFRKPCDKFYQIDLNLQNKDLIIFPW